MSTADSNDDDNNHNDDALVQQKENMNYFENHFGVPFTVTPKEEKNNTVTVIPKSHPQAIAEASVNNASMSLTLAPPEHDCTFCQVGVGKLPITDQLIVRNIYQNRAWNISRIQGEELCFF